MKAPAIVLYNKNVFFDKAYFGKPFVLILNSYAKKLHQSSGGSETNEMPEGVFPARHVETTQLRVVFFCLYNRSRACALSMIIAMYLYSNLCTFSMYKLRVQNVAKWLLAVAVVTCPYKCALDDRLAFVDTKSL